MSQDKPALFRSFFKWLKPGGKVLISDYCKCAGTPSPEFAEYIKQRGYDLHDVKAYGQVYLHLKSFVVARHVFFGSQFLKCLSCYE